MNLIYIYMFVCAGYIFILVYKWLELGTGQLNWQQGIPIMSVN